MDIGQAQRPFPLSLPAARAHPFLSGEQFPLERGQQSQLVGWHFQGSEAQSPLSLVLMKEGDGELHLGLSLSPRE